MSNTNFTPNDTLSLDKIGFCLPRCCSLPLKDFFKCMPSFVEGDDQHWEVPPNASHVLSKCDGKFDLWSQLEVNFMITNGI